MISLAGISVVFAFICQIRLTQKATKLANQLKKKYPDLWSELTFIARNSSGGYPGIKILIKRKQVELPKLEQEYKQLQLIEKKLLCGLSVGMVCIASVIIGFKYLGWHW